MVEKKRRRRRRSRSRTKKSSFSFGKVAIALLCVMIAAASLNKMRQGEESEDAEERAEFEAAALSAGRTLLYENLNKHSVRASQVYLLQSAEGQWSLNGSLEYVNAKISNPFYVEFKAICDDYTSAQCWSLGSVIVDGQQHSSFFEALRVAQNQGDVEQVSSSMFLVSGEAEEQTRGDRKIESEFSLLKYRNRVDVSFRQDPNRRYKKLNLREKYRAQGISYRPNDMSQGVPFKLLQGLYPVIEVMVNGNQTLNMMIDTGASRSWVPAQVFSEDNQAQVAINSLCLANGFCFEELSVVAKDSNYSQRVKGNVNGLLGLDVLRITGLTLDYGKKLAYFLTPRLSAHYKSGTKAGFNVDQAGRARAVISVGRQVYQNVLLDTGAGFTTLSAAAQLRTNALSSLRYSEVAYSSQSQKLIEIGRLPEVCIDGSICDNYIVSFDFVGKELVMSRHGGRSARNPVEKWGMQLSMHDPSSFIWLDPKGMAARKGIANTMTIVTLNNARIEDLGYVAAQTILDTASSFTMTVIDQNREVRTVQFN